MAPWIENAQDELAFFAGFHDGDGCVAACADVRIHQALDNGQALDRLVELFGGALGPKPEDKRGNRAPSLLLRLRRDESIACAKAIAPFSLQSRKRGELEPMAEYDGSKMKFGELISAGRRDADDEIDEEAVRARMTLSQIDAYFAGFFFADGSIGVQGNGLTGTRMTISQKDAAILRFAERHFGCGSIHPPSSGQSASNWRVCKGSKELAARFAPLLPPGSAKREATELVRDVTKANAKATRARLRALAGNKPSGASRRKNAKGSISKHKKKGVLIGYYAKLFEKSQAFAKTTKTPEENKALAEACLAEFVREHREELAAEEAERARAAGGPANA